MICTESSTPPEAFSGLRKRKTFVLKESSASGYRPSSVVGQGCRRERKREGGREIERENRRWREIKRERE